jgi:hypothetical protein
MRDLAGVLEMVANSLPPAAPMPTPASMTTTEAIPEAANRRSCVRSFIRLLLRLLTHLTVRQAPGVVVGGSGGLNVSRSADFSAVTDRSTG